MILLKLDEKRTTDHKMKLEGTLIIENGRLALVQYTRLQNEGTVRSMKMGGLFPATPFPLGPLLGGERAAESILGLTADQFS